MRRSMINMRANLKSATGATQVRIYLQAPTPHDTIAVSLKECKKHRMRTMASPAKNSYSLHTSLRTRLILLRGVARRFFLNIFKQRYVRESLARRQGECRRCGVCCHLVANTCGALRFHKDGQSSCRLYTLYRLPNCCTFPIDARDLADRDLVAPDIPCGYFWPEVATRSARGS